MFKTTPHPPSGQDIAHKIDLRSQVEDLERRFVALREQARQAQRLASLGTAAAMLAHEANNLLTPVVGYAKYALDHDDVDLMKKALGITLRQSSALTAMADRILGLAIDHAQLFESIPIVEVVEEAVACLCRDLSKDGITLSLEIDKELKVWGDSRQLVQVLFNLLNNARQAMGKHGGRITISARQCAENRVAVQVRDTGCGIHADQLDNIFHPFFTTKTNLRKNGHRGSGLGLAICKDIIEEHRGRISVESEVGKGAVFTITLPCSA
ncbi:MAG: ATP-binding protein [Phycisphaerae bacterium]|nr:ATP-binding protein [Phycisphaerae bacterium]